MSIPLKGLSHKLDGFLAAQSWHSDATGPGSAQIVMLRGCKQNADGSLSVHGNPLVYTGHYDDVLCVYGIKQGGQRYLECYEATAKPGLEWIRHKSYAGSNWGCPTVQPGQYLYQRGHHRGRQAMVQAGPVCVIRDVDQDAKLEVSDRVDYPRWTGINIHAGGTSDWIGYNSSGCQVVRGGWTGKPWREFRHIIYGVASAQDLFHYTVVDFAEFGRWHDADVVAGHYYLRYGSRGASVVALQEALGLTANGKFGRDTDERLRAWQRRTGQTVDGRIHVEDVGLVRV